MEAFKNQDFIRKILTAEGITENVDEILAKLTDMHSRNDELFDTIRFEILDEKYKNLFNQEQLEIVACYPDVQKQIIEIADKPERLELLRRCVKDLDFDEDTFGEVIDRITNQLCTYKDSKTGEYINNYDNLLGEELTDEDIHKLVGIMLEGNSFNISTVGELRNYENIKNETLKKCIENPEEMIGKTLGKNKFETKEDVLRFAILEKLYGQSLEYTKDALRTYGDITNIEPSDLPEIKYVKSLKIIMETQDENLLRSLYSIDRSLQFNDVNPIEAEQCFKSVFSKEFNKGLCKVDDLQPIQDDEHPDVKLYDAGTNFKMMITSIAPFVKNAPENFSKDWNRNTLASQGFCCSYISNDMLGTAPIPHLCYGFNEMGDSALTLSGAR